VLPTPITAFLRISPTFHAPTTDSDACTSRNDATTCDFDACTFRNDATAFDFDAQTVCGGKFFNPEDAETLKCDGMANETVVDAPKC